MYAESRSQQRGASPLFIATRDLPSDDKRYTTREMCAAAERTSGFDTVLGAQRIGGVWRLYPKDNDARMKILLEGMVLRKHTVMPFDKNPFIVNVGSDSERLQTTKVVIGNVPISYSDQEVEAKLVQIGCTIRSKVLMERDRDDDGRLTRWLTGRRFIYIDVPAQPLPSKINIGPCQASVFHYEQKLLDKPVTCSRCLQSGHRIDNCTNDIVCRTCKMPGHKSGDASCSLQPSGGTDPDSRPSRETSDAMVPPGAVPPAVPSDGAVPSSAVATPQQQTGPQQDTPVLFRGRDNQTLLRAPGGRSRSASAHKRQRSSPLSPASRDKKAARTQPPVDLGTSPSGPSQTMDKDSAPVTQPAGGGGGDGT